MLVHPQPGRCNQGQTRNVVRRNGRHFARNHSAHREARQNRVLQAKPLHHVPGVQREIQHVAQLGAFFAIAIARHQRCVHVKFLRQPVQETELHIESAGAVQKHQRRPAPPS